MFAGKSKWNLGRAMQYLRQAFVKKQEGGECVLVCWEQNKESMAQRGGRWLSKMKSERWMRKHGSFRFFGFSSKSEEKINAAFDLH